MTVTVDVDSIIVGDRARQSMVGIDSLAASIESIGLLHPIVVTPDHRLVAGGRRLAAVTALGWSTVPVTVAEDLTEAAALLQAESDENTEREPLKPTEAAALAARIEAVLAPLAKKRQEGGGKLPQPQPKSRDLAAKAAGTSATSIRKVRLVQQVIESDSTPEPVRALAADALTEMDATGKVDAGHKRVKAAVTAADYVTEFPDLQFFFDQGDHDRVVRLGSALAAYEEPERSMRVKALQATVAAEKRRGTREADPEPDYLALAHQIFVAVNDAMQVVSRAGGADTIRQAMHLTDALAVNVWRTEFQSIQSLGAELLDATRPTLRSVK